MDSATPTRTRVPATADEFGRLEAVNRALAIALAPPGKRLDPAVDASRVLRVPGTRNYKYDPPRPTEIVSFNPGHRYNLSDLEPLLPETISSAHTESDAEITGWKDIDAKAAFQRSLGQLVPRAAGRLVGILQEPESYIKARSWSEVDFEAACTLARAGLDNDELAAVWRSSPLGERRKTRLRDDYVQRTIAKARAQIGSDTGIGIGGSPLYSDSPVSNTLDALLETPTDLMTVAGSEADWLVRGLLARESVSLLSALPKLGKTTFVLQMIRAASEGRPFIGVATRDMRVLYLTEENRASFRQALGRAQLGRASNVTIIRRNVVGQSWPEVSAQLPALCEAQGISVVVVDTVMRWWSLEKQGENDSATVLEALDPVRRLAATGVAVLLVHHLRKMDGDEGTQARGSGAIAAAVDVIMELRRAGKDTPTRRELTCYSRFDETPANVVIDLGEEGYRPLGDHATVRAAATCRKVWDTLPAEEEQGQRRDNIEKAARIKGGDASKALRDLEQRGLAQHSGAGVRNDPQKYRRRGKVYREESPESETDLVAAGQVKQWTV